MESENAPKFGWRASFKRILGVLPVLGLSVTAIVIASIGAILAESRNDLLTVMASSGIAALIALGVAGRKVLELEESLEPKFKVFCETERSESRNQRREDDHGRHFLMDFLGIEIRNAVPKPIRNVHADLIEFTKPSGMKWFGRLALNFHPRDLRRRKEEPINEIPELRQDVPEMACLCSIRDDTGEIMFGTYSWNWSDNETFASHLSDKGDYLFTIRLSGGDGTATKTVRVTLNWTGRREDSIIRIVDSP